jgi:transposase-like protein
MLRRSDTRRPLAPAKDSGRERKRDRERDVATMLRTIFAQPDSATVHEQHARIVEQLETRFPEAAALLNDVGADLLAFTGFPKEHWRQLWSNNSLSG